MSKNYYFDHAATTPCSASALKTFTFYATQEYGNPSSTHQMGIKASEILSQSRFFFGEYFNVESEQVIFTSSGTEADNLAVFGTAYPHWLCSKSTVGNKRIVVSSIEHPAVLQAAASLKELGFDVQLAPVDPHGLIDLNAYQKLLTPETILVSIMKVNNIVGSINDVEKLAQLAKEVSPNCIFHTDAIQAFGKVKLPTSKSSVDLVSLSGHKIYAPKGIGALIFLNKKLLEPSCFRPLFFGGGQEFGMRPGTQSPSLIGAFLTAAKDAVTDFSKNFDKVKKLQNHLKDKLNQKNLLTSKLSWNSPEGAIPHITNLSLKGIPSGPIAKLLNERHCFLSTGSACSSKKSAPDHVLKAMNFSSELCQSTLRVSLSPYHTSEEVDYLVQSLNDSIKEFEAIFQ